MHATVRRVGTDAQLQRSLLEEGFAAIPTSRLDTTGAAFAGEAAALRERAERVAKDAFELWADGQEFRSPVSYGIAFDTERLHALHFGGELRELANGLAGRDMEPTYSGYLYFEDGDFIGLHTDLPACELTFLAPVRPACPPLVVHPLSERPASTPPRPIQTTRLTTRSMRRRAAAAASSRSAGTPWSLAPLTLMASKWAALARL